MLKSRLLPFVTITMLCLVLIACTNESASNQAENEGDNEGTFELSIMANLHTPEVPTDKILNLLEEETNTNLDIQWVPDSTYAERLNSAFATGTFPQAVYMKNITTFLQFKEAIRDDQFWELGPYLDDYDNLKKLKPQVLENTAVDGKIYALYQGRPLSRQGIIYRKDWADNLGLSAPTNIDEFYNMLKAFTEDDPDGNGRDDTIGLTDRSDLVYGAFKTVASWFGTPNEWGFQDGELRPEFMFSEYMDTLAFFRDLHEKGYINSDFPVTSKPDQQAMIKNGTAGVYVGSMGDVGSLYNDAAKLNPDVEYDVHNYVEGPHGEYGIWAIPGYGTVVLFPKSSVQTEEELRNILAFYNHLMDPQVSNLIYWGIEGEHYEVQEGGAVPTQDQDKNDREVKPFQALEIGEPETNGRYEGLHTYSAKAKSEELVKDNENYLIHNPTLTLDSPTLVERGERLKQIISDATYNFIIGQIDKEGFEKAVENWRQQGGDQIIEEFNASYNEMN
ncbi:extracellular solute-binding protein [Caldalkalibacillus salinus]|uniref:extracellular solute-binding protein n=1 Tax=Caldalkalibacillus salinus TaxID=2803787 RepID=UPI0019239149|nr:extracellular solute-binding protein [Caldalkalibacillus salinus]